MGYVEENLLAGETVVYRMRLHWIVFLKPAAFVGVLLVATALGLSLALSFPAARRIGVIVTILSPVIAVSLVIGFLAYLNFVSSEFAVTTHRVLIKVGAGFFWRRSLEILLQKVESIRVEQGILGRILGYGTIIITGTGGTQEVFDNIAAPLKFRGMVQGQTPVPLQERTATGASVPRLCIHCGKYYDGNPSYCPNCGHAVKAVKESA